MKTWKNKVIFGALCAFTLSSCAHRNGIRAEGGLLGTEAKGGLLNVGSSSERSTASESNGSYRGSLPDEILGVRIENKNFDLPVEYNQEVHQWMEYFTGAGRRHFSVYLERKAKFEPVIKPRLSEAGVPLDLIYLAMIESGFSTSAHSHAGAVGPWQFIKSTGRIFGLKQDWWRDERRDPIKSTDAAIRYLTNLHEEFGDWRLACAAYNSGEGKIRRAISKLGTRDFWEIARDRRALMRETKDYVPKMMAAAIIGKNAEQFGFRSHEPNPVLTEFEEVYVPKAENLRTISRVANISRDQLSELNPELMRCCTPPQRGAFKIRVPRGESARLVTAAVEAGELGRYADFKRHVVKRGDSLSTIASRHGVPVDAILSMNEIRSARALKPGTELVVPEKMKSSPRSVASVARSSYRAPKGTRHVTHVVKSGDTLYGISKTYAVRVEQIRRWNAIHRAKSLRPGSRIKLYVKNENTGRF